MNNKKIDWIFDKRKLPKYDYEYLKSMINETINNRSYKNSGKSFDTCYKNLNNYTVFNNKSVMHSYMNEFSNKYEYVISHLLNGKKYYFAWTFSTKILG